MSVADDVRAFIVDQLAAGEIDDIGVDEDLLAAGIVDSFGLEQLIAFLEDSYSITLTTADLKPADFQSIRNIELLIDRRRED